MKWFQNWMKKRMLPAKSAAAQKTVSNNSKVATNVTKAKSEALTEARNLARKGFRLKGKTVSSPSPPSATPNATVSGSGWRPNAPMRGRSLQKGRNKGMRL